MKDLHARLASLQARKAALDNLIAALENYQAVGARAMPPNETALVVTKGDFRGSAVR